MAPFKIFARLVTQQPMYGWHGLAHFRNFTLSLMQPKNVAGLPYQAQVLNGNGADMIRACLLARGCWHLIGEGEDHTAWNLWWGNNGQICPFKRFRNRALLIQQYLLKPASVNVGLTGQTRRERLTY
jgi:hypothetical protein